MWRQRDKDRDSRLRDYERDTSDRVSRLEGEQAAYRVSVSQRMDRIDDDVNRLRTEVFTSVTRMETILEEKFTQLSRKIDDLMENQGLVSGIGVAVKWIIILGGSGGLIGALVIGALRFIGSVPPPGTALPP